jgi:hypothetical protein
MGIMQARRRSRGLETYLVEIESDEQVQHEVEQQHAQTHANAADAHIQIELRYRDAFGSSGTLKERMAAKQQEDRPVVERIVADHGK